ncbi:MAG: substrate-binding domain-containing protein [Kiritimatiellae bacterium]|nr:substrate-binding domain-containing protein [Kiritimatiellia bacterium]
MNVVLFFQSTSRKSWRDKLAGAFRFAQERNWLLQVVEHDSSPREIRRALQTWCPIGCLVDRAMSVGRAPDKVFGNIPVVYLDQNPALPSRKYPCILHDSAATARLGAHELLGMGYKSYGFAGQPHSHFWIHERAKALREAVQEVGGLFSEYKEGDLRKWLDALPKPCGILAANDQTALLVHHAAQTLGLGIPDDVALVGIDNDELYCETMRPGITSVQPDFEEAGYRLAAMLAQEIANPDVGPVTEMYGPKRIVRRGSTRLITGKDARVRRALEFIRQNACVQSLGINDVLKAMNCSRRLATLLFRKTVGHSILDEIHEVRFEKACDMLKNTDKPISVIIASCGYASESFFKKRFLQRTGMTMRAWRKS